MARFTGENQRDSPVRNLPQGHTVDKQRQLQPDSQSQKAEQREPRGGAGRRRGAPRPAGGPTAWARSGRAVSTRDSSRTASPRTPTAARAGPAARSPPARARALPPARAPRPGTGLERCVPLVGSQPARPEPGRSRSWQGAPARARSRLPRASGPPRRPPRPPGPSRRCSRGLGRSGRR